MSCACKTCACKPCYSPGPCCLPSPTCEPKICLKNIKCCPIPQACCPTKPKPCFVSCCPSPCGPKPCKVQVPKCGVNPYAICVPLFPCDGCCVPVKPCGVECQPFATPGSKNVNRCDNESTRNIKYPEVCLSICP